MVSGEGALHSGRAFQLRNHPGGGIGTAVARRPDLRVRLACKFRSDSPKRSGLAPDLVGCLPPASPADGGRSASLGNMARSDARPQDSRDRLDQIPDRWRLVVLSLLASSV